MKYAVISDVHANLQALEAVLSRIEQTPVDQIICLGDLVGYNADPNECVEVVREREIPTVCGNHDAVACGLEEPWDFNPIAREAANWTRDRLTKDNIDWLKGLPVNIEVDGFLAAHGSPIDRDFYMFTWEDVLPHVPFLQEKGLPLCFFGHTHFPGIFSSDGTYSLDEDSTFRQDKQKTFFINVGSVGQPRDGDIRAAFGLYDSDESLYELVRVEYPVEEAAQRVRDEGLPEFLSSRLKQGR